VFAVPFNRAGQHLTFGVTSNSGEVFNRLRVVNAGDILLNNGAFVQIGCHIVRRRAYEFDATVVGLVVRLGTFKAGQEAVMNIDGFSAERVAHVVT